LSVPVPEQNEAKAALFSSVIDCQAEAFSGLRQIIEDLLAATEGSNPDVRRTLLVAGCKRALQTGEVIVSLAPKQYVEDMAILSRTLAETAINTCYLQVCSEDDLKRFMIFDPIADLKLHKELREATGYNVSRQAEAYLETMAQKAIDSGLFGKKQRSWTETPLGDRARLSDSVIDARFNQKCLQILRTSVYQHGHTFVHFTRRGLGHFASAYLKAGEFTTEQRAMQVLVMVGAANHGIMALATFLMSKYELATHGDWNAVNELLHSMRFGIESVDLSPPE
jgi:hypothetical protein